jgi:hypothetical protein
MRRETGEGRSRRSRKESKGRMGEVEKGDGETRVGEGESGEEMEQEA